jgi:mannosyltransferase
MPAGAREAAKAGKAERVAVPAAAAGAGPRQAPGRRWPARGWRRWLPGAACVLGPALVTLLVTGYRLGSVSLWRDEAYTIEAARRSIGQIFALLRHTDAVNSGYYLLLHPVIAAAGTSEAAVRLPSVLAMAVTAGVTAATGRRLALLAGLPAPALTGAIAGLLFAAAPMVTRYGQEARSYALVAMMATIATYLLLRALAGTGWRWWAGYSLAIAVAGLFNLLALLLVAAHGVTLLIIRARRAAVIPAGAPAVSVRLPRWLAAVAAAVVALSPLLALGYLQRHQISWLGKPGSRAAVDLAASFAGSKLLVVPVALVALAGIAAGLAAGPAVRVPPAAVALPWLVVPPLILLAVSQVSPVYDGRYVLYCLPALPLLAAAGLSWLAQVAASPRSGVSPAAAWLPAVVIGVGLAGLLVAPQQQIRSASSRPDNLREASAILAGREQPGDAVFYLPPNMRVMGLGYPAPFRRLRDVALARPPVAAANLIGTSVHPAVLRQRMAGVTRVWVVTGSANHRLPPARTPIERAELAVTGQWRLAGRWTAGMVGLRLYQRP